LSGAATVIPVRFQNKIQMINRYFMILLFFQKSVVESL